MAALDRSRELLEQAKELAKEEKEKATTDRKSRGGRRRGGRKKATVPARVEPGWLHYELANFLIEKLGTALADSTNSTVDMGHAVEVEAESTTTTEDREPVELLARVLAHLAYRLPFLNKIEKRLEGREAKSGLGADLSAFIVQLWRRNKHLVPIVLEEISKARANKASSNGQSSGKRFGLFSVTPKSSEQGKEGSHVG